MEKIYKKICLEDSRSRSQGLMPFIKYGESGITYVNEDEVDGNWGGYPYDFKDYSGKTYMDTMLRYFSIWKQLRNGIYLKKLNVTSAECQCAPYGLSWTEQYKEDKNPYDFTAFDRRYFYLDEKYGTYFLNDEMPEGLENEEFIVLVDDPEKMKECAKYLDGDEDWERFCRIVDDYLGKIQIPMDKVKLGDRVPYVMYYADIPQYLNWLKDNENSDDCCVQELWKKRGGREFMEYLETLVDEYEDKCNEARTWTDESLVPCVNVSLALRQSFADEGVFVPYKETLYDDYDGDEEIGYVDSEGNKIAGDERGALSWPYSMESTRITYAEGEEIEVPSYLPNMMHTPYFYDDRKVKVAGTLKRFGPDGDGFFECTYHEMPSDPPSVQVEVTWKYEDERGRTITMHSGWCETEESTAWPQNSDPETQVVHPRVSQAQTTKIYDGESTEYFIVGSDYSGYTIASSTTVKYETKRAFSWWEAVKVEFDPDTRMPADGDVSVYANPTQGNQQYRVLTMLEAIDSLVPSEYNADDVTSGLTDGDVYYFLVTYDNGFVNVEKESSCSLSVDNINGTVIPADIPFDLGNVLNIRSLNDEGTEVMGDSVLSAVTDSTTSSITLTYVIGGKFTSGASGFDYIENTGVVLEETHDYEEGKAFEYVIDGVSSVTIYCNYIDFESDKKMGVSSYNGLSGLCNTSLIKAMDVGDVMVSPSGSIRSVIYKEDYLLGVSFEPETDIDIEFNNGTATAWEKHFKLGECNTMSDLVNYGNDEFGLNN